MPTSDKSRLVALLLCFFFGAFGVHRFYVGKIGTGLLMLVTLGCLGIWALIDFIMIAAGSFRDKQGRAITVWSHEVQPVAVESSIATLEKLAELKERGALTEEEFQTKKQALLK